MKHFYFFAVCILLAFSSCTENHLSFVGISMGDEVSVFNEKLQAKGFNLLNEDLALKEKLNIQGEDRTYCFYPSSSSYYINDKILVSYTTQKKVYKVQRQHEDHVTHEDFIALYIPKYGEPTKSEQNISRWFLPEGCITIKTTCPRGFWKVHYIDFVDYKNSGLSQRDFQDEF